TGACRPCSRARRRRSRLPRAESFPCAGRDACSRCSCAPMPMALRPKRGRAARLRSTCCRSRSRKSSSKLSPRRSRMAWAKAWHDTRWRFAALFAVLVVLTCFFVLEWPRVQHLMATLDPAVAGRALGSGALDGNAYHALGEQIAAQRTFRGYIWYQWFDQNFASCVVLFAALLGSGSVLSTSGRGLLFS